MFSWFCDGTFNDFLLCDFIFILNIYSQNIVSKRSEIVNFTFHSYLIWSCILLRHKGKFTLCRLITPHYIIINNFIQYYFCYTSLKSLEIMLSTLTLINLIFLAAGQQPHIIFVFIDDLGWNDVGYHGSEIMVRKGFTSVVIQLSIPICSKRY